MSTVLKALEPYRGRSDVRVTDFGDNETWVDFFSPIGTERVFVSAERLWSWAGDPVQRRGDWPRVCTPKGTAEIARVQGEAAALATALRAAIRAA